MSTYSGPPSQFTGAHNMAFDAKTDTPAAATDVAATDKFVFGDVSADGWDTILAENVLKALLLTSVTTGPILVSDGNHIVMHGENASRKVHFGGKSGTSYAGMFCVNDGTSTYRGVANTGNNFGVSPIQPIGTLTPFSLTDLQFTSTVSSGSPGAGISYVSAGQIKVTDGSTGLGELITDKLIARQDGGVAGTDEVQIYHDGTYGYVFPKSGDLYLGGHDSLFIGIANGDIQFLNNANLKHQTNTWYLSSLGYFRCQVQVEANTAGSGSPNILASTESRTLLTNEGTTAENYHTLPTAAAGLDFEFVCQDADGIRIVANTGDTLRDGDIVSASAGYLASTKIGSVVRVKAINATEWVVVYKSGHWVVDGVGSATATQITGDQNNYAPATASFLRISSDAARNITGLLAGMDGEQRVFLNVGSYAITLKHESASSTAANRFTCATAADIAIGAGSIVALVYDGTSARWRAR